MSNAGTLVPFDTLKGMPRIISNNFASPKVQVGIYVTIGGSKGADGKWDPTDGILLVQKDGKWVMWHRKKVSHPIIIDEIHDSRHADSYPGNGTTNIYSPSFNVECHNKNMRSLNRGASWYPTLADPSRDLKCWVCNGQAFWSQWCYNTMSGNTNGRIIDLCKECTLKGKEDINKRSHCKLSGEKGTDRLIYEFDDTQGYKHDLKIRLRIHSKNLHMLDNLPIQYYRWSDLPDDLVVINADL